MVALARVMVAAPSTGQGKTTIATGLMAALRGAGHAVSGHKVGPDYIDPGYHALATCRPGRNLDPHLVGEQRVAPLLLHGAAGADVAVIEGVMGLYDGRLGTDGFASTAHVAMLTESPVVLVVDVGHQSRSVGAIVAGMAAFEPRVGIAGVILNRAGSDRNVTEIRRSIERTNIPVLGAVPHDDRLSAPSRHLGLVPAGERDESAVTVERLGRHVAGHVDLDALLAVAGTAAGIGVTPWNPSDEVSPPCPPGPPCPSGPGRPIVAMAGGRAFTFRYAETEELLRAAGCDVVTFDPLTDDALPEGTQGIYLGGGFPEVHVSELAANRRLLHDVRRAVSDGIPTVAECAGLLYLAESLDGVAMAGTVPAAATMTGRLTLRYPEAVATGDTLLTRAGERVTGHEFHRTRAVPDAGESPAWEIDGGATGFASETWHASYLHVHWAGHTHLAQRFADAVHAAKPHVTEAVTPEPPAGDDHVGDPLRHHGDAEAGAGFLDFAVNVYTGERPDWLDDALHAAVDASAAYPDAEPARAAAAQHHGRPLEDALVTAGAAEAFSLIARMRPWRAPVVVHPQFTEPHAALEQAGHRVTTALCQAERGFALDPAAVPDDADLVIVGNPTNPTGVLHAAGPIRELLRSGRLVVVDEAFMDAVPEAAESLAGDRLDGLVVVRSLTKHWSIPGIRAGYVVGDPAAIGELEAVQSPWSVSGPAVAATIACTSGRAASEARRRALTIEGWRRFLEDGLRNRNIDHVPSAAPFVLARLGAGVRTALRADGIAVRRADTFPGLDASWARIAVRPQAMTARLLAAIDRDRDRRRAR